MKRVLSIRLNKVTTRIILLTAATLLFLGAFAGFYYLAATYPFQPGDALYGLQDAAEQTQLQLTFGSSTQAQASLELVERRLADLAIAQDQRHILLGAHSFDQSLDRAIQTITAAPEGDQQSMFPHLQSLVKRSEIVLSSLEPSNNLPLIAQLHGKIQALLATQTAEEYDDISQARQLSLAPLDEEIVSFLGKNVEHSSFPLEGGHSDLGCMDCHENGLYVGTPSDCASCHLIPNKDTAYVQSHPVFKAKAGLYPDHFEGECADCHTVENWQSDRFDHQTVWECYSCHSDDIPKTLTGMDEAMNQFIAYQPDLAETLQDAVVHYPGDCGACHTSTETWEDFEYNHANVTECESCHSQHTPQDHYDGVCTNCHSDTEDWNKASYDHADSVDCLSCHKNETPANHYEGQCSNCHDSDSWELVSFDHTGYTECLYCHTSPANHYEGECDDCHNTKDWRQVNYNHDNVENCLVCHSAPANHYPGDCLDCHNTHMWASISFSHMKISNCATCHSNDAPSNHYKLECSQCHTIQNWSDTHYDHTNTSTCADCHQVPAGHYTGLCTNCHTTRDWQDIHFDHSGLTLCASCHTAPAAHYTGQCSNCHNTSDWSQVNFDHSGLTDCSSCHDAPNGHWPGQCSSCHVVQDWSIIDFDHSGGYVNCNSCHTRPSSHPRGQCSRCHNTDDWLDVTETPTPVVTDTPVPTDPAPTDPAPTDPAPTDPAPTDPAPTEPEPTEPEPTETEPIEAPVIESTPVP